MITTPAHLINFSEHLHAAHLRFHFFELLAPGVLLALGIFNPYMFDAAAEIELLTLIATGNEQAFRKLYIAYRPLLRTHIFRLTESLEMADEIVQDVFLKIWNTREALAGIQNFKAYLFVVSKNYAISYLRKHVRQTILHQQWQSEESSTLKKEGEDTTTTINYYSLLDEAIDQLPPQQKKAYLLSRHQRLTYIEIAEQMGISRETVKSYLQTATASISVYVQQQLNPNV